MVPAFLATDITIGAVVARVDPDKRLTNLLAQHELIEPAWCANPEGPLASPWRWQATSPRYVRKPAPDDEVILVVSPVLVVQTGRD